MSDRHVNNVLDLATITYRSDMAVNDCGIYFPSMLFFKHIMFQFFDSAFLEMYEGLNPTYNPL